MDTGILKMGRRRGKLPWDLVHVTWARGDISKKGGALWTWRLAG